MQPKKSPCPSPSFCPPCPAYPPSQVLHIGSVKPWSFKSFLLSLPLQQEGRAHAAAFLGYFQSLVPLGALNFQRPFCIIFHTIYKNILLQSMSAYASISIFFRCFFLLWVVHRPYTSLTLPAVVKLLISFSPINFIRSENSFWVSRLCISTVSSPE